MIAKAVVTALSFQTTDFPPVAAGQPPRETFTFYDTDTDRDPRAVTVLLELGIPVDSRPKEFEQCVVVLQIEEVERAVKRQDREDGSRTYDSVTKQQKLKVLDFEPAPGKSNGRASAPPAKAAA
jgi:hypothetical protein